MRMPPLPMTSAARVAAARRPPSSTCS